MPPLPNAPTLKPHYGFMHNVELSFTLAKDTFTLSPDRGTGRRRGPQRPPRLIQIRSTETIGPTRKLKNLRAERIELSHQAWEARRLPLHHAR